ncbi:MAG: hypothetical protein WD557_18320 [Dehalococcoidia bacterium]
MAHVFRGVDRYWNWRTSAHFRIGSVASAWLLLLLLPVLGWLVAPLAVARSGASFVQTGLNIRLGKHVPVGRPDRWDWSLIASIFLLAYMAAGVSYATGMSNYSPVLMAPLLLPFTALQLRMARRSFAAHGAVEARPAALLRLEDYRRGELREVA